MSFRKRGLVLLGLLAFTVLILFAVNVSAADWPMFMNNPQHTGYQNETIDPSSISLLWNFTNTEGGLFSFPLVIANDTIYSPDMVYGTFFAINATTGSQIWNNSAIIGPYSNAPVVSDGVIYIMQSSLYALNATDGSSFWNETNASIFTLSENSPTVVNGIIYTYGYNYSNYDYKYHNNLLAINATTGSFMWNSSLDNGAGDFVPFYFSSPTFYNGMIYTLAGNRNEIYAFNATNGSLMINFSTPASTTYSYTISIDKGVVYAGGSSVFAFNATTGTQIWNYTDGIRGFGSASSNYNSVANGVFYTEDSNFTLCAFNVTTGTPLWNSTLGNYSSISTSNGVVWTGSNNGIIRAFNATTGTQIWNYTLSSSTGGDAPSISNGMVYIGDGSGVMYAFGPHSPTTVQCDSVSSCNNAIANAFPGDTVQMNKSITVSGLAINFAGYDGITFDCAGYSISGDGTSYGILLNSINGGSNNNTIENCTISTFNMGVSIQASNNTIIKNVNSSYNTEGFDLSGSNQTLTNLTANHNSQYGVFIGADSFNNTLTNVSAYYNSVGVEIYSSTGNYLDQLILYFNTNSGLYFYGASNNTVLNLAASLNGAGLQFGSSGPSYHSVNNTILNSYVFNNTNYGLLFYSSPNNTFYNNIFNNTLNYWNSSVANNTNYFNTTLIAGTNIAGGPYVGGNAWDNSSAPGTLKFGICADVNKNGICDSAFILPDNMGIDYLPLTSYTAPPQTTPPSGTPGGSSGGGTTVASNTTTATGNGFFGTSTTSATFTNITAGTAVTMYTNSSSVPLNSLTVTTNQTVYNATLNVSSVPVFSTKDLRIATNSFGFGNTYQSFSVTTQNINDSVITQVVINFSVNTSWITSKKIDPNTVSLYRNTATGFPANWVALPTTWKTNDSQFYYFSAVSPGFSNYTIYGESPKTNEGGFLNSITPAFFRQTTFGYIIYYVLLMLIIGGIAFVSYNLYKRTLWINFHNIWKEINKKRK